MFKRSADPGTKCFKAIGFVHNDELVGKITEDPKSGFLIPHLSISDWPFFNQSEVWNQNESLSAFTLATLIEVTKCGRRPIVYEDPKTLKEKTVDPRKVIREGFDCFKDGFEGNSYLAVMVFRLGS